MTDFRAAREAMVDCQVRPADVTTYGIIETMLEIPRELFVPASKREIAYAEADIPLSNGRVLLSPRTLAKMLEVADVRRDDLILDVAPGPGYSTAVLARLAAAVVAVEDDPGLAAQLQETMSELDIDNVVLTSAPATEGDAAHGPYDVIFVNGAVAQVPDALTAQLKDGGRLVAIFQDGGVGQCRVLVRAGDNLADRFEFNATAPVLAGFEKTDTFAF